MQIREYILLIDYGRQVYYLKMTENIWLCINAIYQWAGYRVLARIWKLPAQTMCTKLTWGVINKQCSLTSGNCNLFDALFIVNTPFRVTFGSFIPPIMTVKRINVNFKVNLAKFGLTLEGFREVPVHLTRFRLILGGSRKLPVQPKPVQMAKYPSKKAGGRVSS